MHWFFLFYLLHHNKEKFIEIIEFSKDVKHVLNNNINNIVHQQQQQTIAICFALSRAPLLHQFWQTMETESIKINKHCRWKEN